VQAPARPSILTDNSITAAAAPAGGGVRGAGWGADACPPPPAGGRPARARAAAGRPPPPLHSGPGARSVCVRRGYGATTRSTYRTVVAA